MIIPLGAEDQQEKMNTPQGAQDAFKTYNDNFYTENKKSENNSEGISPVDQQESIMKTENRKNHKAVQDLFTMDHGQNLDWKIDEEDEFEMDQEPTPSRDIREGATLM